MELLYGIVYLVRGVAGCNEVVTSNGSVALRCCLQVARIKASFLRGVGSCICPAFGVCLLGHRDGSEVLLELVGFGGRQRIESCTNSLLVDRVPDRREGWDVVMLDAVPHDGSLVQLPVRVNVQLLDGLRFFPVPIAVPARPAVPAGIEPTNIHAKQGVLRVGVDVLVPPGPSYGVGLEVASEVGVVGSEAVVLEAELFVPEVAWPA